MASSDFRSISPRFREGNLEVNLELVERLRAIADDTGASVAQLAIAWAAAQGKDIIPLIGARTREQLMEALGAMQLHLTPAHVTALEEAVPVDAVAGARYPEALLMHLDSERSNRN